MAAEKEGVEIKLVGVPAAQDEIAKWNKSGLPVTLFPTDEYVQEGEPPAMVLRKKPKASVLLAAKMVRTGEADAVVSAGPTGSVMAAAMGVMGLIEGIERPVIGGPFVGFAPNSFVLDLGANVDSNPYHLLNFAVIGTVYVRRFLNIENPKVALLSVGSEEGKGNETVREAYSLFKRAVSTSSATSKGWTWLAVRLMWLSVMALSATYLSSFPRAWAMPSTGGSRPASRARCRMRNWRI